MVCQQQLMPRTPVFHRCHSSFQRPENCRAETLMALPGHCGAVTAMETGFSPCLRGSLEAAQKQTRRDRQAGRWFHY